MIRKAFFVGMIGLTSALLSCGEGSSGTPESMCDCIGVQVEIMNRTADLDFDDPEVQEIEAEYEEEMVACEELGKEYEEKFEGLSQEEVEAEQQKILDDCPAYEELQSLMDAQMEKFQEQMQNMEMDDMELDMDELESEMEAEMEAEMETEEVQ